MVVADTPHLHPWHHMLKSCMLVLLLVQVALGMTPPRGHPPGWAGCSSTATQPSWPWCWAQQPSCGWGMRCCLSEACQGHVLGLAAGCMYHDVQRVTAFMLLVWRCPPTHGVQAGTHVQSSASVVHALLCMQVLVLGKLNLRLHFYAELQLSMDWQRRMRHNWRGSLQAQLSSLAPRFIRPAAARRCRCLLRG